MLRVSRALELRIGLRVKLRAELRAELQGGDPLGNPPRDCVLYLPHGQSFCRALYRGLCKAFVELLQSFGRALCRASVELRESLMQSHMQAFARAVNYRCL